MSQLLAEHSLNEPDIQECPWAYYNAMRERGFYFDTHLDMYVCANYGLMREILRNPTLFSSVNSQNIAHMRKPPPEVLRLQAQMVGPMNILVSSDPPEHGRIRDLLDAPFRRRAIEALRPKICAIVDDALDRVVEQGRMEAVADFAIPIPVTVIADLLGIARDMATAIKDWSDAAVEPLGLMISDARWIECTRATQEFQRFITAELTARRAQPRDDLLSHLAHAVDDNGQSLSLGEMLSITSQLLVAGNETTTNGIAAGIQMLIENPQQQQILREEPARMLTFVNEVLRLESPVQGLYRITTADTCIDGVDVPKGARIMVRFAAANRDPGKYSDAETLDVRRRNAGTHVGFGAGIHHCLGANLAREEMLQAFSLLLERIDGLRYVPDLNQFAHHPNLVLRGLKALHVEFSPR